MLNNKNCLYGAKKMKIDHDAEKEKKIDNTKYPFTSPNK